MKVHIYKGMNIYMGGGHIYEWEYTQREDTYMKEHIHGGKNTHRRTQTGTDIHTWGI